MLFDTHAHLDSSRFQEDRQQLLARLPEVGIGLLMNPGCDQASSEAACALAAEYPWIYAAVGSHPDDADKADDTLLQTYWQLAKASPKVKAVGEIGLDYYHEDVPRERQILAFRQQMDLAQQLELPVIIHQRDAAEDTMRILAEFPGVTGVLHCYSGSAEMARQLTAKGWYIGITGVITFKNARRLVEAAGIVPLDRIVVETDCPYLTPEPFRGRRNDPGYLYRAVEKLAELRNMSREEMEELTFQNGKRLYRLD